MWLRQASVHSTLESHSDRFDVVTRSVKENAAIGALGERLDSTLTMVESRLTQMEADVNSKAWVSSVETAEQQLVAMGASRAVVGVAWPTAETCCTSLAHLAVTPRPATQPHGRVCRSCPQRRLAAASGHCSAVRGVVQQARRGVRAQRCRNRAPHEGPSAHRPLTPRWRATLRYSGRSDVSRWCGVQVRVRRRWRSGR